MQNCRDTKRLIFILITGVGMLLLSCNKNNFLDKKPSSNLLIPSTLTDFQALLDNDKVMQETPELGELSADDFYLSDSSWRYLVSARERNAYVWALDIYNNHGSVDDWNLPYQQIFYANVVLDGLPGVAIDSSNLKAWKSIQGSAYFIRAYAFYNIAQVFAPVYDMTNGNASGIPLRLNSDVNRVSVRANVKQTYDQILSDLRNASDLLSSVVPHANLNRPSKPAALAMMARVYLSMGDYLNAGLYADSCLLLYDTLIDYNKVPLNSPFYFSKNNAETIYQSHILTSSMALGSYFRPCVIDSALYKSYVDNDLRKQIFFVKEMSPFTGRDTVLLNTGYSGSIYLFSGLATDEVYLIKAECLARLNPDLTLALHELDTLMQNRYAAGTFVNYSESSKAAVLDTILVERRKELPLRSVRWTDLRRLNANDNAKITLTRRDSILSPNSQRYVLPIPPDVIGLVPNAR